VIEITGPIVRQVTKDEREEGIRNPLEPTGDSVLKKKIDVQEAISTKQKKPFCRPCVWADWERAKLQAQYDTRMTSKMTIPIQPDPKDNKYWDEFELVGDNEFMVNAIVDGVKQEMVGGRYIYYACKKFGHKWRVRMTIKELADRDDERKHEEKDNTIIDKRVVTIPDTGNTPKATATKRPGVKG